MKIPRWIMNFFGRAYRPPETPFAGLQQNTEIETKLASAVQKHKDVSNWVIEKSLDTVDKTEQVRLSLKAIFDREDVPGMSSAQGAFELISRGKGPHADHP